MPGNYTQGGWHRNIPPASRYPVIFAGRNTHVAQVKTQGIPESEAEANAYLIAAAPALLEALQAVLAHAAYDEERNDETIAAVRQARAALALARGDYDTYQKCQPLSASEAESVA